MKQRIQKILAAHGVASRRASEKIVADGRITINGEIANIGSCADPDTDVILVDGKPIPQKEKFVTVMLYKPVGYITTMSDEQGRPDVSGLVSCGTRVYPVGRLDCASEGLLLFTNDGDLAYHLMHPSKQIEKTYVVTVRGRLDGAVERLKQPIEIKGKMIAPPKIRVLQTDNEQAVIEVTIHEGRNRQIRRMCKAAGLVVLRLVRIQEGSLKLGNLKPGEWRTLTESELKELERECGRIIE